MDYPTDEEFEAWREEALADEARNAEPAPEPRSKLRAALALVLEHHKPNPRTGETWDDALAGLRASGMASAVWQRHSWDLHDDPPIDHDDLWHAAAWLLRYPDWASELWAGLLFQRHRFLHAQPGDLP